MRLNMSNINQSIKSETNIVQYSITIVNMYNSSLTLVLVAIILTLLLTTHNRALAQQDQLGENRIRVRCPDSFDKENPIDANREKIIYEDMLKASEDDIITKELLIESGLLSQDTLRTQSKKSKRKVFSIPIIFHMFTNTVKGVVYGNVPNGKYLNVWVCDMDFYLGFATFPWRYQEKSKLHGVVLHYAALPQVEGYYPYSEYNEGDSLMHEVGHFFGLYHTFQGGCDGKDIVSDTPAEAEPAFGKPCLDSIPLNTCKSRAGVDPVRNYMDYTDDLCLDRFSPLQRVRMRAVIMRSKPIMASKHKN